MPAARCFPAHQKGVPFMTRWRISLMAALALFGTLPAAAGDYPYAGFFADTGKGEPAETTAARCALAFFEQRPDGSFGHYHIDNKTFRATGTVQYLHYREGSCSFDSLTRIETCESSLDLTDRDDQVYDMYIVYGEIGADRVAYTYADTPAEAAAIATGGEAELEDDDTGYYVRCPIDAAVLRAHIAAQDSSYSEGAINAFDDPASSLLKGDLARGVLEKLNSP
jgi:hypothetical protein